MTNQVFPTAIRWVLMFRVATHDAAMAELRRAEELLGRTLQVSECEPYWKIPELWRCTALAELGPMPLHERNSTALILASRIAYGWYVLGPYLSDEGTLESFEGIFNRDGPGGLASLDWAHFELVEPPK
jgi:hypothetical protein